MNTDDIAEQWYRWHDALPDSDGNPNVFNLEHDDDDLWLNSNWYNPTNEVDHDNLWFVRLRNFRYFSPDFISGEFCCGLQSLGDGGF